MFDLTGATRDDFFELLAQFSALAALYREIHWSNQSELFYQDHLLAERLYNEVSDEIDAISEKGIGATGDRSFVFVLPQLARQAELLQPYPHEGDTATLFAAALAFENGLASLLDEMFVRIRSAGVNDFIGQLADGGLQRIYLLKGRLSAAPEVPEAEVADEGGETNTRDQLTLSVEDAIRSALRQSIPMLRRA